MWRPRVGVALLALFIYVGLPTKNYYWDGIGFAQTIENARQWSTLLHPNHLVYELIGYIAYRFLGASVRALYILQTMNAVFAAATVYLIFGIVGAITRSESAALLLSAFLAFSGTWWRFATDADAYVLSVFFLTGCALLLVSRQRSRPIVVAVLHAFAMLVHQLAVFFFPAALIALWRSRPEDRPQERTARILQYTVVAGTLTIAAYLAAFFAQNGSLHAHAFWIWTTSHAEDAAFSFHVVRNAALTTQNWIQLFLVGRPALVDYSEAKTLALLALFASSLVTFVVSIARQGLPHGIVVRHPALFSFALAWLAAYIVFLFFWLPHNTFYKLFALPAIVLLIASCGASERNPVGRGPAISLVAAMALSNLTFAILPYSRVATNPALDFATQLNSVLRHGAVVYYWNFNTDDWFVRYFNPQTIWRRTDTPSAIDADLRAGQVVWLDTTAVEHFALAEPTWLAERTAGAEWRETVNARLRIRFVHLLLRNGP